MFEISKKDITLRFNNRILLKQMNMKKMMMLSLVAFVGLSFTTNAQEKTYPKQEPMRPGMSEYFLRRATQDYPLAIV